MDLLRNFMLHFHKRSQKSTNTSNMRVTRASGVPDTNGSFSDSINLDFIENSDMKDVTNDDAEKDNVNEHLNETIVIKTCTSSEKNVKETSVNSNRNENAKLLEGLKNTNVTKVKRYSNNQINNSQNNQNGIRNDSQDEFVGGNNSNIEFSPFPTLIDEKDNEKNESISVKDKDSNDNSEKQNINEHLNEETVNKHTKILEVLKNQNVIVTKVNNNDQKIISPNKQSCCLIQNNSHKAIVNGNNDNAAFPSLIDRNENEKNVNPASNTYNATLVNSTAIGNDVINKDDKITNLDRIKNNYNLKEKDVTEKGIKEFEDVLAEVKSKNNSKMNTTEDVSSDEIVEIMSEELQDDSSAYNFQEIIVCNEIESADNNTLFNGQVLENIIMKLHDEIATKMFVKDNSSIISLSSDDDEPNNNMQESVEVNQYTISENDKEDNSLKYSKVITNIETISLSSDTSQSSNTDVTELMNVVVEQIKTVENVINDDTAKSCKVIANIETVSLSSNTDITDLTNREGTLTKTKETDLAENLKLTELSEASSIKTVRFTEDTKSDDDCGYHSSDFEFITAEEAKLDGFIINYNPRLIPSAKTGVHPNDSKTLNSSSVARNRIRNDPYGPGPSSRNHDYRKSNNKEKVFIADKSYKENYAVPDENKFLNMFHGEIPGLPLSEIHFLENKSVRTRAPMLIQYDGIGFDMNLIMHRFDSSDDEHRDEAEETYNKILAMYPDVNTQRKRSRRQRR